MRLSPVLPTTAQRDCHDEVRGEMAVVSGDVGGALDLHPRKVEAVLVRRLGQRQQVADVAGPLQVPPSAHSRGTGGPSPRCVRGP